jgi:hypothetical protein
LGLLLQTFGAALESGNRTVALFIIRHGIGNGKPATALVHVGLGACGCGNFNLALDDTGTAANAF